MPDPSGSDPSPDHRVDPVEHEGCAAADGTRPSNRDIAVAFSGHRFREYYDYLASDIEWVAVGATTTRGKDAVTAVCEDTLAELVTTSTETIRHLSVADADGAVVDSVARYTDPDGNTSAVASCDIYEFDDGRIARITSYALELDPSTTTAAETS